MECPDSTEITLAILPAWCADTRPAHTEEMVCQTPDTSLTFRGGDVVEVVRVLLYQSLDEIYLLQRDLHRVLVLGAAGSVRHPQL